MIYTAVAEAFKLAKKQNKLLREVVKKKMTKHPAPEISATVVDTDPILSRNEYPSDSFQEEVNKWMLACFGEKITSDTIERNHRFLEEALELVQANGCTKEEAYKLVDYVFNRPVGDIPQEIGGVMVTLAALCNTLNAEYEFLGYQELERVWTKVEQIREKQKNKPKNSPLPEQS